MLRSVATGYESLPISGRPCLGDGLRSSPFSGMPPEVRTLLVRFRDALACTRLPDDDAHGLAKDLVDHLIALHDAGTLTAPFLKLALEPFHELPQVAQIVGPLVRFAAHQSAAMGLREFKRSDSLPWITSSYANLEPNGVLDGLSGFRPSDFPPD
ncbi:hypothetical protein [Pseudorhodoferax sp. Leaf265]|jgi:hypothetical protein|uniref:hypothetical protein n=1 Tax=Pseudorhodoferax sp. Leaf265 TaxID=1736315 RepID=UPI0012E9205E|nr:hypothetical protein [Pseudorhodoferax sp. Leaf265]